MARVILDPIRQKQVQMARWKARTDLEYLARYVLNYKDVDAAIHGPVLDILQKFPTPDPDTKQFWENDKWMGSRFIYKPIMPMQELPGSRRRLILDPRGHLKTTINVQAHTIQWILNYPDTAIAIWQSNLEKAKMILKEIKHHFQYNEKLRELFPELCPQKRIEEFGTIEQFTIPGRSLSVSRREPTVMVLSIEKGTAGLHFDVMKFSDIVEPDNVKTIERVNDVKDAFRMAKNLLVSPPYWIDVEGTRYHHEDLYGELIKQWKKEKVEGRPHEYEVHIRGIYKKVHPPGKKPTYTPDDFNLPDLIVDGKKVPLWPFDRDGMPRFPLEAIDALAAEDPYMFSCSRGDQPILMADWSQKPISEVVTGDMVLGFVRKGRQMVLAPSRVLGVGTNDAQQVFKIVTDKGRETYQSADHRWYAGKVDTYKTVSVGSTLYSAFAPFTDEERYPWLGGFFDGEGSVHKHYGISVYQKHEAFKRRFVAEAARGSFDFRESLDPRRGVSQYALSGGRSEALRFCRQTGSEKGKQFLAALWGARACEDGGTHTIVSMEPVEVCKTYFLTTETGNYVVSGFLSANCQQLNQPIGGIGGVEVFPAEQRKEISRENFRRNIRVVNTIMTVDTAETRGARSNYSAIVIASWDQFGRCYVRDIIHGKWLPDELIRQLFVAYRRYRPGNVKIEKTSFVSGLMAGITREMDLKGEYIPIELVPRDNQQAKEERIQKTLQPYYKNGLLRFIKPEVITETSLPEEKAYAAAYAHMLEELKTFPIGGTDDILDALADQFQGKEYFGREQAREDEVRTIKTVMDRAWDQFLGMEDLEEVTEDWRVINLPS